MATDLAIARIAQAGEIPIDTFAVLGELMSTWDCPDAMDFAEGMVGLMPHYQLLMQSYETAQSVQRTGQGNQAGPFGGRPDQALGASQPTEAHLFTNTL